MLLPRNILVGNIGGKLSFIVDGCQNMTVKPSMKNINYTGLMLFALVAGVFSTFGFYMGRVYQNYLIDKAKAKPSQDDNDDEEKEDMDDSFSLPFYKVCLKQIEKLKCSAEEMANAIDKLHERNRELEENSHRLEEKCRRLEQ